MNNQYITVYEAGKGSIFSPMFFIFFALVILFLILGCYYFRNRKGEWLLFRIISFIPLLWVSIVFLAVIVNYCDAEKNVYQKYVNGEYSVVEGTIIEYTEYGLEPGRRAVYDSFCVNGVEFTLPAITDWGYNLLRRDDGILENGVQVKIYYVFYKYDNEIVKIELLPQNEDLKGR